MLKIDFLVPYCMETVGVKSPGLKNAYCKLSDTLLHTTHTALYTSPLFYFCTFAFLTFVLLYFHGIEEDHSQDLLYWDSLCYESLPTPCRKHCDSSTDIDHCPYTPAASLRGRNFVHGHWSMPSHWSRDADYLCLRVPNTKYSDSFTEPSLEEIVPYL